MNNQNMITQAFSKVTHSVSAKLATIAFLVLLLLIPGSMIQSLIREREYMNETASEEVRSLWANEQTVNGPILSVPLTYEYKDSQGNINQFSEYWHLLPEKLKVNGTVDPQSLRRGIYEIVVYESDLQVEGQFQLGTEPTDKDLTEIQWEDAMLTLGISDLRGVKDELQVSINGEVYACEPGSLIPELAPSGVTIPFPIETTTDLMDFRFKLSLQGSKNLSFTPIGNTTEVQLSSSWTSPSFNGNFLPDSRELSTDGFSANWKVLQLNRNFPSQWIGTKHHLAVQRTAFGLDLILPLDDYQKSMRSAKYAAMTIALTFLIFFLIEILNKTRIHPFQYTLVGLALCLFYVLLVSISEHTSFNLAYGLSTLAITAMVTLYAMSIFKKLKTVILLSVVLIAVYGFVFVTLQMTDFALVLGSIGLTITLAATMYYTRNINWYATKENVAELS
ncbi:MAG: cell envelope integrity protein CreD [Cytophagales bacterium]|nr:cell envelope integrity protein CreD [Cytophagales bacterium]